MLENMKRLKSIKGSTFVWIFGSVLLAGFLIWAFLLMKAPNGLQSHVFFWQDPHDIFMDFYNTVYFGYGRTPYTWGLMHTRTYFPLAYMIVYPFAMLYPYNVEDWGTSYAARTGWPSGIAGFAFMAFSLIIVLYALYRLIKRKEIQKLFILLAFSLSSVMLFNYDRGNLIVLTAGLVVLFFLLKDQNEKWKRYLGCFFLAVAAVLKIFPAFFAVLLLFKKRYKEVIITVVFAALLAFLPFLWLKGWVLNNMYRFQEDLTEHARVYAGGAFGLGARNLFFTIGVPRIISYFVAICAAILSFFHHTRWKRILLLTLAVLLASGQQEFYCYILIFIPIVLFLNEKEHPWHDLFYLIGFLIMLIPYQYSLNNGAIQNYVVVNTVSIMMYLWLIGEAVFLGYRAIRNHIRLKQEQIQA